MVCDDWAACGTRPMQLCYLSHKIWGLGKGAYFLCSCGALFTDVDKKLVHGKHHCYSVAHPLVETPHGLLIATFGLQMQTTQNTWRQKLNMCEHETAVVQLLVSTQHNCVEMKGAEGLPKPAGRGSCPASPPRGRGFPPPAKGPSPGPGHGQGAIDQTRPQGGTHTQGGGGVQMGGFP